MAAPDAVDVRRLRRSAFLAGLGDGVVAVALPLLAAGLTRDPLAVAGVIVAQHLPWPLLALALPALRQTDRRTLAGAGNSARAVAVAVAGLLAVVGNETILTIQLVALVVGAAQALTDETERLGGELLRDRAGGEAHATLAGAGITGLALLGLPLGGVLYEVLAPVPLLFDVGVFAVAALFALAVQRPLVAPVAPAGPGPATGLLPALAPGTRVVTAAAAVAAAAGGAVAAVLVLVALDDLGLGAPAFGLLLAGLTAASLVGALVAPTLARVTGATAGAVMGVTVAAAGHVAAWALLDPALPYPAVLALGAGAGGGAIATVLVRVQRHGATRAAPGGADARRAFSLAVWAATPFGAAVGGLVGRAAEPADVLLVAAGGWLLSGVLSALARSPGAAAGDGAERITQMP